MKRIAVSAIVAGGLFLGAMGAAGAANATEIHIGPDGAGITAVDGGGIGVGPNGVRIWSPDSNYDRGRYYDDRHYDGRYYDRSYCNWHYCND